MQSRIFSIDKVHVEFLMVIPENPPAIAVSANGRVITTGWTHPDLSPWMYIVPPKDGILDMDFVASAPAPGTVVIPFLSPIGVAKAFVIPAWLRGVRVHSSTNSVEATLEKGALETMASKTDDWTAGPWPFPWWVPKTVSR